MSKNVVNRNTAGAMGSIACFAEEALKKSLKCGILIGMLTHKHLLKAGWFVFLFLLILTQGTEIFSIPVALAQRSGTGTGLTGIDGASLEAITTIAHTTITILNVMMWVVFHFLRYVIDPVFIFGTVGGGQPDSALLNMLHEIWQISRDIVNIIFALLLIVGAIMTIVTAKSEEVKTYLPKFVLALVLVNFSWFIPRAIYDFSQVVTYTVYQLPSLVNSAPCRVPAANPSDPPTPCQAVVDVAFLDDTRKSAVTPKSNGWTCPLGELVCIRMVNMDDAVPAINAQSRIFNGLIVNFARLPQLMTATDPRKNSNYLLGTSAARAAMIFAYIVKLMIVLLIHVALFFPMLAMLVAFFIRIPLLWITMAFMPFVAVGYVIGHDKIPHFNLEEMLWKTFIGVVFLPALVGVPLTIGFIMINAGITSMPGSTIASIPGVPLFTGINSLWQLMWMFMALFVMWTGVFTVLKNQKIIEGFTEPIRQQGEALGQLAYKAPLSIPFIPTGTIGGANAGQRSSISDLAGMVNPRRQLQNLDFRQPRSDDGTAQRLGNAMTTHNIHNSTAITNNINTATSATATQAQRDTATRDIVTSLRNQLGTRGVPVAANEEEALIRGLGRARNMGAQEVNALLDSHRRNVTPPTTTPPAPTTPPATPTPPTAP